MLSPVCISPQTSVFIFKSKRLLVAMALQTGQATETRAMHPNYTPAALELTGERNPRGIPAVKFIEDVEAHLVALYCKGGTIDDLTDEKVAECVGVMQELYSKYKFMEQHLVKNKVNYRNKLPELKKSISMIEHLQAKAAEEDDEPLVSHFNLSDNVYTQANIDVNGKVCLWLGANVMLEYTYEEALEVLNKNLSGAQEKLNNCSEDSQFLRDCIITSEVNIARVFNYDVRRRRVKRDAALLGE